MKTRTRTIGLTSLSAALLCFACDTEPPVSPYPGHIVLEPLARVNCAGTSGRETEVCLVTRAVHEDTRAPVADVPVIWRPLGDATMASFEGVTDSEGFSRARVLLGAGGSSAVEVRLANRPNHVLSMSLNAP